MRLVALHPRDHCGIGGMETRALAGAEEGFVRTIHGGAGLDQGLAGLVRSGSKIAAFHVASGNVSF